jgi:hypothetical protein
LSVYHDGKPEVSVQLLEAVGEAADVISNEWDKRQQNSAAWCSATCTSLLEDTSDVCRNNPDT